MLLPNQLFLSDLLKFRVRCSNGIDHGHGVGVWMHPPVHRLLGWVSKPSSIKLSRDVWSLNQIKAITDKEIFVKGFPSVTDQSTYERLPSLIDACLISKTSERLGIIADLSFCPNTGNIFNYLVSRTDPRIPGTSRWLLSIDKIIDQQPGLVSTNLSSIDELPLIKSSIRQDFIKYSRNVRDQIQVLGDKASDKLEGWLEEQPWDSPDSHDNSTNTTVDIFDQWSDKNVDKNNFDSYNYDSDLPSSRSELDESDEDPWI